MRILLGVKEVIGVAHHPKGGGPLHGHTYEVVAWFGPGHDMVALKRQLRAVLDELDHTTLPDDLTLSEEIGAWVMKRLPGCRVAEANRPSEGFLCSVMP